MVRSGVVPLFLLVVLLAMAWPVRAIEVVVRCEGARPSPASLSFEQVGGSGEQTVPVQLGILREIEIDRSVPWKLIPRHEDCWSPGTSWDGSAERIELEMLPAGSVVFDMESKRTPENVTVSFLRPAAEAEELRFVEPCQLDGSRARCLVPAGALDLRVEASGYAPSFFWNLAPRQGADTDLGSVRFVPGASIVGWVAGADLEASEGESVDSRSAPVVEAQPVRTGVPRSRVEKSRKALTRSSARVDERGHFLLAGLEPGLYRVRARSETRSSQPIEVRLEEPGSAVEIEKVLTLLAKSEPSFFLDPHVDPWGQPWNLEISRRTEEPGVMAVVAKGAAVGSGSWTSPPLDPGEYQVSVYDTHGGAWRSETARLVGGPESLFWTIDVVPVRGELRLGEEPLETVVSFGEGSEAILFETDEGGIFEGSLPREGWWAVGIEVDGGRQAVDPVEVRMRPGRSVAEIGLTLPATLLRGEITKEGEPVRALVVARRTEIDPAEPPEASARRGSELSVWSARDGSFRVSGLAPGLVELRASTGKAESEWTRVVLSEDREETVRIEIADRRALRGRISSAGGQVSGIRVLALLENGETVTTVTDATGGFELRVSSTVRSATLVLRPPGGGISLAPLATTPEEQGEATIELPSGQGRLILGLAKVPEGGRLRSLSDLLPEGTLSYRGAGVPVSRLADLFPPEGGLFEGGIPLPPLATGWWRFCPAGAETPGDCQEIQLLDGASVSIRPNPGH